MYGNIEILYMYYFRAKHAFGPHFIGNNNGNQLIVKAKYHRK